MWNAEIERNPLSPRLQKTLRAGTPVGENAGNAEKRN
jgi:hypothetical protein